MLLLLLNNEETKICMTHGVKIRQKLFTYLFFIAELPLGPTESLWRLGNSDASLANYKTILLSPKLLLKNLFIHQFNISLLRQQMFWAFDVTLFSYKSHSFINKFIDSEGFPDKNKQTNKTTLLFTSRHEEWISTQHTYIKHLFCSDSLNRQTQWWRKHRP